jgi:protein SCO1/2
MEKKLVIILAVVLLALVALTVLWRSITPEPYFGAVIEPPVPRADFMLHSENGPVHLVDFRGKYVVLYFGYTRCPDVCPTTLANLRQALSDVPGADERFQVLFVSVDHKSDTPVSADEYARVFNPNFIGLTGSREEIGQVTKDYGIYYQLNEPDPDSGFYTVDHTASVMVLDPDGNLILTWFYGMQPGQIAADIRKLMEK